MGCRPDPATYEIKRAYGTGDRPVGWDLFDHHGEWANRFPTKADATAAAQQLTSN